MPDAALRACSCRGCDVCNGRCPNTTEAGKCGDCKPAAERAKTRDSGAVDRKRVYNSRRWRGLRRQVLREEPWCRIPGCTNLSSDVDHVVPLRQIVEAGGDPYARENVQGLCKRCHSEKTAREVWHRK